MNHTEATPRAAAVLEAARAAERPHGPFSGTRTLLYLSLIHI